VRFVRVVICADVRDVAPLGRRFAGFAGVSLAGPLAREGVTRLAWALNPPASIVTPREHGSFKIARNHRPPL
jgi:hypothetical protein